MKYFLYLLLILSLVSCGKKNQIKVTAKNAATGEGFSGLGFRIFEVKPYTTPTGEVQELVYEGNFNANGEAVAEIRLKNRSYVITTVSPGPMCYINNTQYFFHRNDDNLKFDFLFAPCDFLKFSYENIDCQGSEDCFEAYRYTNIENYTGFIVNAVYEGCTNYTMPNFVEVPMGWWYFEWKVIKNGVEENFSDSVYLGEGEELLYEFQY